MAPALACGNLLGGFEGSGQRGPCVCAAAGKRVARASEEQKGELLAQEEKRRYEPQQERFETTAARLSEELRSVSSGIKTRYHEAKGVKPLVGAPVRNGDLLVLGSETAESSRFVVSVQYFTNGGVALSISLALRANTGRDSCSTGWPSAARSCVPGRRVRGQGRRIPRCGYYCCSFPATPRGIGGSLPPTGA